MSSALQHYMKLYSLEQTMESVKREADPERQDEIMQELRIDAIDQTNNLIEVKGTLTAANERVRKKMRTGKIGTVVTKMKGTRTGKGRNQCSMNARTAEKQWISN